MSKPQSFVSFLSQLFSNDDITMMADELGIDPENLTGGKSSRARQLYDQAVNTDRLDDFLHLVGQLRPTEQLQPYLYLLIARYFKSSESMQRLAAKLSIDYKTELLDPFNLFHPTSVSHAISDQSWRIYELCAEQDRLGEIVTALREERPALKLDMFAHLKPVGRSTKPTGATNGSTNKPSGSDRLTYENFDIRIGVKGADDKYPVEVTSMPNGAEMFTPVRQEFPLDDFDFTDLVDYLSNLKARASDAVELGKIMRDLLFPDEVWTHYFANRTSTRAQGKGLRIRLRIDAPELSGLPWEYCYDDTFKFFALQRETPLVRYVPRSFAPENLNAPNPMRVLLAVAAPSDQAKLDIAAEIERVEQSLSYLGDRVQLRILRKATPDKLHGALAQKPHVFHFIGHGDFKNDTGVLIFENIFGKSQNLDADQLMFLMSNVGVKVVILNACKSAKQGSRDGIMGVAPALVAAEIPAVIAMQFNVPDRTAVGFTRDLYRFLAAGYPLDTAVTEMRIGAYISSSDKYFWGIPTLFMRSPDGVIWQPDPEVLRLFDEAAAAAADVTTSVNLTDLLAKLMGDITTLVGLDPIDLNDIQAKLGDVNDALGKESPSLKLIQRRLKSTAEILEEAEIDSTADLVTRLNELNGLATQQLS